MPEWLLFILAVFACFRLSELITVDDGPGDMFLTIRAKLGAYDHDEDGRASTNIGRAITCPWCIGIWIAAILAIVLWQISVMTPLYWLAIAGGQASLQKIVGRV